MASPTSSLPLSSLFSLTGKTILMTGATGGIGLTLALALAEAGANIISIQLPHDPAGHSLQDQVTSLGRTFQTFECNLRKYAELPTFFDAMIKGGIKPDIFLNCAGVTCIKTLEHTTVEDVDVVTDINFKSAYILSQQFGLYLRREDRPGKIIHVSSMAAQLVQTEISVYAPTKAAIRALTRAQSNEWARHGIQVNCIGPGFIHTQMTEQLFSDPEFTRKVVERTAARRWGEADDLRGVAVFLASAASDFVTGEEIIVDGGVIGL